MAGAAIDMGRVRQLFSRPDRLATGAFLRREVARRMQEKLALVRLDPARVLDIGCGAGEDVRWLADQYPHAHCLGIDLTELPLQYARRQHAQASSLMAQVMARLAPRAARSRERVEWCLADMADLPLAGATADLLWSNLALHWHADASAVLGEWARVLRPEGVLLFSTFGPDTFKELRLALASHDAAPRTLAFVDMHDLGDQLLSAGFADPVMDMETLTLTYAHPEALLADVRGLGGNPRHDRPRAPLDRAAYRRVLDALQQQADADGRIPLTLELVYGHAFRPQPRQLASGEQIIRLDFPKKRG